MKKTALSLALAGLAMPVLAVSPLSIEIKGVSNSKDWENDGWIEVAPGIYEREISGQKQQVATGEEALIADVAALKAKQDLAKPMIDSTKDRQKRAVLQNAYRERQRVIDSLEAALSRPKGQISDATQLAACEGDITVEATLSGTLGMVDFMQVSITAGGESFIPFSLPQAWVSVTADLGAASDSDSKDIYTSYMGDSVSASVSQMSWCTGTPMSASAYIVPACSIAGYRRATLSASCSTVLGSNPTSPGWSYSQWRRY